MAGRARAPRNAPLEVRLRLHMIEAPSGCWIWTASRGDFGYGRMIVHGRTVYAHRAAHETWVGPIPDGLWIDHLCRRPACIRPLHLQAVTPRVNILRGTGPGARAHRRPNCLRGHSYAEFGVIYSGRRVCSECCRQNSRAARAAAKDAAA